MSNFRNVLLGSLAVITAARMAIAATVPASVQSQKPNNVVIMGDDIGALRVRPAANSLGVISVTGGVE